MPSANRWRLVALVLAALLAATGLLIYEHIRQAVLQEAEDKAAVRLLRDFHAHNLAEKGADFGEYQAALKSFADRHKGLSILDRYVKEVQQQ